MGEQETYVPERKEGSTQKPAERLEISSENGLATYSLKYEDGTVGPWRQTGVSMAEKGAVEQLRRELEEQSGLNKPKEE